MEMIICSIIVVFLEIFIAYTEIKKKNQKNSSYLMNADSELSAPMPGIRVMNTQTFIVEVWFIFTLKNKGSSLIHTSQ
jgi:hypothetical protein